MRSVGRRGKVNRPDRFMILAGALDESSPPSEQLDIFTFFSIFAASVSV